LAGASGRPASGYTEDRLVEDDLRVLDALKLVRPVMAGHSVAGNELSELGIRHDRRIGGLVCLDALNDGADDYTDYDALCGKLPEAMRKAPTPSPSDLESFPAYRDWRTRTEGIAIPEAEWRNDFAENPDGSVGNRLPPGFVPAEIMAGNYTTRLFPDSGPGAGIRWISWAASGRDPGQSCDRPWGTHHYRSSLWHLRRHDQESHKKDP
jgi:pimeloyl-ACP methyl ester carboxylesterase